MSVEAIQCPKCGGPLSVEEGRDSMYCSHCGAGLRISTGSSGHPMATLADIKDDTSLLATRAALERLEERLQERHNKLRQLEDARTEELRKESEAAEQRQAARTAKASKLRSQLRWDKSQNKILWSFAVLPLAAAAFVFLNGYKDSLLPGTGISHGSEWSQSGWCGTLFLLLLAGGFFTVIALFDRRRQWRTTNLLQRAVQDDRAPDAESTDRKQKHKEALHRIDAELDEIRSQIQAIERQRHTLRAKLDGLTDQL